MTFRAEGLFPIRELRSTFVDGTSQVLFESWTKLNFQHERVTQASDARRQEEGARLKTQ